MGVKSLRPTWFEDEMVAKASADGSSNTLEPIAGGGAAPSPCTPPSAFFNSLYLTRKNPKKSFIFGGQKIKQINAALRV